MLHAIGYNAVHGAEQAIEEAGNPEMLLPEAECLVCEAFSPQVLVSLSVVGQQGRHLGCSRKGLIAQAVLSSQCPAAIQLTGQFIRIHPPHLSRQQVGFGLKQRFTPGLAPLHVLPHYLGIS